MNKIFILYHPVSFCVKCEKVVIDQENTTEISGDETVVDTIFCDCCGLELLVTGMRRMEHEVYDEEQ